MTTLLLRLFRHAAPREDTGAHNRLALLAQMENEAKDIARSLALARTELCLDRTARKDRSL